MDILAQILGILAMIVVFFSFQQKTQKSIAIFQFVSSSLWTVHFLLLGAYTGCILNIIAVLRDAVFMQRNKHKWAAHIGWLIGTVILCFGVYVLTFTVFDKEPTTPNLILELLPVIGMGASTISLRQKEARHVRMFALISAPLWLIYDAAIRSLGGTVTEIISIISISIGIFRLDRKKR